MKGNLGVLAVLLGFIAGASWLHADIVAQWDFNSPTPDGDVATGTTCASHGSGSASPIGGVTGSFVTGDTRHDPAGTTDNSGWRTTKYPAADAGNKSSGVRFDVDTTGFTDIFLSWYQQNSATASRYARLQYTVDGSNFYDAATTAIFAESVFTNNVCDLTGILGVADNPAFGFQIVSEWESSAMWGGADAYVATKDGSKYSTSGTVRFDLVTVVGTPIPGANTPPFISAISNQVLRVDQSTGALGFTVGDHEDQPELLTVTASSSDENIIPTGKVVLGGNGSNRSVTLTAIEQSGSCLISITVTDSGGRNVATTFTVTVLPANTPPMISLISRTNTLSGVPTSPLPFVIGDAEMDAENLALSGISSNVVLVPEANIVFGGRGSNRTVTITPAQGQTGIAPIWISVSDGTNSAEVLFPVLVTATEVILCDDFTYPNGSLVTNSAFLWDTRSGIAGQCQVVGGQLQLCATQTEDVVARLVGAPFAKTNSLGLYASFKVRLLTLPKPAPAFFAHFASGSTLRGRVYAGTTNAAEGCFRLQVANGAGPPIEFPQDLSTNVTYQAVTRYMIDSAQTTLWLNPESELDTGISAADPQNANSITAYGFRQDTDLGATILIDDLVVGLSFAAVTGGSPVNQVKLETQWDGANLWLIWTDSRFLLQSAAAVEGAFTEVPGASSPYCVFPNGAAGFFRLKSGQSD